MNFRGGYIPCSWVWFVRLEYEFNLEVGQSGIEYDLFNSFNTDLRRHLVKTHLKVYLYNLKTLVQFTPFYL